MNTQLQKINHVCCDCKVSLGPSYHPLPVDHLGTVRSEIVSYGLCETCAKKMKKEIDDLKVKK